MLWLLHTQVGYIMLPQRQGWKPTRPQCYKTFYGCNLRILLLRVFVPVPGKSFQPSLMFVGKARSPLKNGAPERCFTQVSSVLTLKRQTRLERPSRDKTSSPFEKFVNYSRKSFITLALEPTQLTCQMGGLHTLTIFVVDGLTFTFVYVEKCSTATST